MFLVLLLNSQAGRWQQFTTDLRHECNKNESEQKQTTEKITGLLRTLKEAIDGEFHNKSKMK
jgi:hypothetical protein